MSRFTLEGIARSTTMALARMPGPGGGARSGARSGELIMTPSDFGSLGDRAMIAALRSLIVERDRNAPLIASWIPDDRWSCEGRLHDPAHAPVRARDYFRWRRPTRALRRLFLIGADVLDGHYSVTRSIERLEFCGFCASRGVDVTITGFSYNDAAPPVVQDALRRLPPAVRLCARDRRSRTRIERITGRPAVQVADLAFLLRPDADGPRARPTIEWIERRRAEGAAVHALCPNRLSAKLEAATFAPGASGTMDPREAESARAELVVDCLAQVVARVHDDEPNAAFVLLSHDTRGPLNDHVLCLRILERCADRPILVVPADASPGEIKAIVGRCDGLLTGRMHCGIAALGAGTPAAFLDYQGKVEGLLEFFDLDTAIALTTDTRAAAARGAELLRGFRADATTLRKRIAERLPGVLALSAANVG